MESSFVNTPICKDCKFSTVSFGSLRFIKCNRPTGLIDVTTGKPETLTDYCSIERMHDSYLNNKRCGPTGRFYEASQWKKVKLFFNKQ
jgi:hypothetical protein